MFVFIGLILSIIALSQIKKTGESGKGLAVAGLVISIVKIVLGILGFIFIIFLFELGIEAGLFY